jgi:hypothetical protein
MDPHEIAHRALERNLAWIRTADTKVPAIFAIDAAMLGVLGIRLPRLDDFTALASGLWVAAAVSLAASVVMLALVAIPRREPIREGAPGGDRACAASDESIVFFGTAASLEEAVFVARLTTGEPGELVRDLACQAFRNAQIAKVKYRHLRLATQLLFIAFPFWLWALAATRHLGG